jgi:predicted extracellular nuclease
LVPLVSAAQVGRKAKAAVPPATLATRQDAQASPDFANPSTTIFINEIHYDNAGTDVNEGVEIAGPAGTNLSGWSIVLYNGNPTQRTSYATISLSGTIPCQRGGYGTLNFNGPTGGIQNGNTANDEPDGIALVNGTTLVQFLSYEGSFVAANGPANGQTSTNIGVIEDGNNATTTSLQLQGSGTTYGNFTWAGPITQTRGAVNTGQTFTAASPVCPPTLSINDVTQDEGNAATTTFTFTVSLSEAAGPGGVSFTVNTANGTTNPATAGTDYVAIAGGSGFIPQGSTSTTVTVTVNGDTTVEPNETFFVNITSITGAQAGDTQGLGTILDDDTPLTPICQIQGSGTASPIANTVVTTSGIVTGIKSGSSGGLFIQHPDCDGNMETSDGVFVFTAGNIPAGVGIGDRVRVTGTVQEFVFASDPNSPPITEIGNTPTITQISGGNPLPEPIVLTPTETTAASETVDPLDTLEEYEGMRVTVPSLTVVAPTGGSITEPSATVSSNGVFYGVVTGVPRPFREPGINISDPPPAGAPANIPRFDENPERLRISSNGQPGASLLDVAAGTIITNVTGPLDYAFRTYTILPDAGTPPSVGAQPTASPVPTPLPSEFTVASFNMERFFDTTNDTANPNDPVLSAAAFEKRLNKASLIIRNIQRMPDVIGVEELENLPTLQAVASRVNSDAVAAGFANPNYVAYLVEGNDIGGIDNGFLVKTSRVTVVDVTQVELAGCDHVTPSTCYNYTDPNDNSLDILNDRPPLVLRATVVRPASGASPVAGTIPFTVIVNHLRSLGGAEEDTATGRRVRAKRRAQAEFLANYIQSRQEADPAEKIISVGDYNAFQFNDGFVDVIGTIKGQPAPPDQVVLASNDLVNPDLVDLVDSLPPNQRYSYTFDGNAQVLDHILVNVNARAILNRFVYARDDADFPVKYYEDGTRPERLSDHDQPIAYFSVEEVIAPGSLIISEFRFRGPVGSRDEFVELYNNTDADITVSTTDGSGGWALVASNGTTLLSIPNNTIIPARSHYLVRGEDYSLSGYGSGTGEADDGWIGTEIPDSGGVALFKTSNPAGYIVGNRLDAAGYQGVNALYREGIGIPTGGAELTQPLEHSFFRDFRNGGTPKDTGENLLDFLVVDADAPSTGSGYLLGAPGPESRLSPIQRNATMPVALFQPGTPQSAPENRVRITRADCTTNGISCDDATSEFGVISIRRTVTNNTGAPVSYLRFRITNITTFPATDPSAADVRAMDSVDITVNGTPVRGTIVEQPPTQENGGGWNSSMAVGFIDLSNPLPATDDPSTAGVVENAVSVQFQLGVKRAGLFRFIISVEAGDRPNVVQTFSARPVEKRPRTMKLLNQRTMTSPSLKLRPIQR